MQNQKLKAIHIHTDLKFIHNTKMFEGAYFSNTTIVISNNKEESKLNEKVIVFSRNKEDFSKIVNLCTEADLVVLYDLDIIKWRLVLAFPKNLKIAWRFFGYELYAKRPDLFKTDLSRKYDELSLKLKIRRRISYAFQYLKSGKSSLIRFNEVLNRIDYFLALSEEEYNFLKLYWPNLPLFVKLPHFHFNRKLFKVDFQKKETEKPIVIIGNNRSSYNNHLDLIELIDKYENKLNYNFTLFLNYGREGKYTNEVIKRMGNKNHYTVINDFLNKEDFLKVYQDATALVINGYRQMAGANIRTALEHGVKVYLNDKNVHKQFLENQGFKIFSIEDFESDLKNNNLGLDKVTAKYNIENFKLFCNTYTKEDFQKIIYSQLKSE